MLMARPITFLRAALECSKPYISFSRKIASGSASKSSGLEERSTDSRAFILDIVGGRSTSLLFDSVSSFTDVNRPNVIGRCSR